MDIGIVIDSAIDFYPRDLIELQEFVASLAQRYNVSRDRNRVGALFFSDEKWKSIQLNKFFNAPEFSSRLKSYLLMNNFNTVAEQLKLAYEKLLGPKAGARISVPKVIVLLTHERSLRSMNRTALVAAMKPIEMSGIRVIVTVVGKSNHFPFIRNIVKKSSDVLMVPSLADALQTNFLNAITKESMNAAGEYCDLSCHPFRARLQILQKGNN